MIKRLVLGSCVPAIFALLVGAGGCTVTNTSAAADGGPITPPGTDGGPTTGDGGPTAAGPLGFSPSNVASAIANIDISKLGDVDLSGTEETHVSLMFAVATNGTVIRLETTQPDGSTLPIYVMRSLKIEPTASVLNDEKRPVAIVALDTVQILGKIKVQAAQSEPGGGGGRYPEAPGKGAGGAGGGADNDKVGYGAGGASFCGVGGAGGLGAAAMGAAGPTYGNATLTPLLGGSAGGSASFGAGGGGGAIQISAGKSIELGAEGVISAGGGGGVSGQRVAAYLSQGGGSGGAVLLEAPTVSIGGIIQANGGGGGAGHGASEAGQYGADATNNATPATGAFPGTTGAGGNGAAGGSIAGAAGATVPANSADSLPGAGGGGAGWIRINTKSGAATISGTISPATTSTCATQGTLAP